MKRVQGLRELSRECAGAPAGGHASGDESVLRGMMEEGAWAQQGDMFHQVRGVDLFENSFRHTDYLFWEFPRQCLINYS